MSIPPLASVWEQPMDPKDLIDYIANFAGPIPLLEANETIASFTVALMPEAVLLGILINQDPNRVPAVVQGGKGIQLWFEVNVPDREAEDFSGAGADVGVAFTIITTSNPSRRRERTFKLTVAQL